MFVVYNIQIKTLQGNLRHFYSFAVFDKIATLRHFC